MASGLLGLAAVTGTCRVCGLRRRLDEVGRCDRCQFVWDVLMAANPIQPRELEPTGLGTLSLSSISSSSRGSSQTGGAPGCLMGNSGRGLIA